MTKDSSGRYARVNGLNMYYEVHGEGHPLVLLHGSLSAISTSFGQILPLLAANRQVVGLDFQAHGRTADIDRPLTIQNLAGDVVELLRQLGIAQADFFGYSMGSAVALELAIRHPGLARKLVLLSPTYDINGLYPEVLGGVQNIQPEQMMGTTFYEEYISIAPHPEDFPKLLDRIKELDSDLPSWTPDTVRAIQAPALLVIGDSDIIRPEHVVEMFRLFGGGVMGDLAGLPKSQLAVLPGTTHVTLPYHARWLAPMIEDFLDVTYVQEH